MSELESGDETEHEARRTDRRDLLKKGALGAGVVGVVWAAPGITGLSLAPAYAAAGSNLSHAACSGDATFDMVVVCPPGGKGTLDVTPKPAGNCGIQAINVDSHWAVGTPKDTTADRPNAFTDITPQDKGPWKTYHSGGNHDSNVDHAPYIIVGIHRANTHCSFDSVTFSGTNDGVFNPVTKQKFNGAALSGSDISIGWASDPNERADLGAPFCSNTNTKAHLKMHCT